MLKFFGEVSIAGFFPESVGASKRGGSADWRNGGAVAGNFSIPAAKLVILPARVLLLFYEYLCSLAGRSGWSTWIGGEPEIWQIVVYYGFLIIVLFMGQYIKEQLRKKKAVSEETELSEERAEAGCWKLYAIRITAGIFLAVGILILGISSSRKSESDLPGCRTR